MEETSLFSVAGLPVTAYALCLVAALGAGIGALVITCRKRKYADDLAGIVAVLALPLGLIGARLFYCVARWSLYEEIGFDQMLRLWNGGYAIWGAIGGAALAGVIAARITGRPAGQVLDDLAAPAALTVCLSRLAEYFSGQGVGMLVENEAFFFFPLSVYNADYDEWNLAVFMLEALAALIIFVVLLRAACPRRGDKARLFLILYSACQVLCESLRRDEFLRWLFVRVSQLTAAIVLGLMMIAAVIRWYKKPTDQRRIKGKQIALLCCGFLVCVGICVGMEFAADKSAELPVWACYLIMACSCAGMGTAAYRVVFKT
ncbi:MAG: prolipoprotein diacylglyceryl transferase [Clostridia bacterium]|nr:prolipoprotein diacylglyceryl transferase [Clostridia bacterium]